MMITGMDYTFISNLSPEVIEPEVVQMFKDIWGNPMIDDEDRQPQHIELFIAKDAKMHEHQEENGFTLDKNGEGCVMFCGRLLPFLQGNAEVISWNEPEEMSKIGYRYTTNISLINIWEYTLVLPGDNEESAFCNSIYNRFLSILKGNL